MTRAQKIAAAVCFVACGLMVVASFMSWISVAGSTYSGWDLVQHQRDADANPLVVWNALTADDGSDVPYLTAWVSILSAAWIAAWTAVLVVVQTRRHDDPLPRGLATGVVLAIILGAVGGIQNSYFYVSASDVSLEAGSILLWASTIVACLAGVILATAHVASHGARAHPAH